MNRLLRTILTGAIVAATALWADEPIPKDSKVYVAPMGGFETYFTAALAAKKVPLTLVPSKAEAEYEITGSAESKKAGAAKVILMGDWHSTEDASIKVTKLKTDVVVFAYSVHKQSSARGKRSAAEAAAKHLKDNIK
jgi:hypothetical protein